MRNWIATLALCAIGLNLPAQIPDFKPPTPLFGAVFTNNTKAVADMLEKGADPNEGRFFGSQALMFAVMNKSPEMVKLLLDKGADPKTLDMNNSTTLMWAVGTENPNPALVEMILKTGVDVNASNKFGETALNWALRRGHVDIVTKLKSAGALDAASIRQSVEKAVALMQKSGPQFVKVSGCTSCHHQSMPQMAYAAAREHGYTLDEAVSAQQVKAVMAMFKPIRERMEKGDVNLPNPGISVGYSLLGLAAEGYAPDETTRAMAMTIERTQLPDGSFGVLGARPPMESSRFTATALSIRALQVYGEKPEERIAKAKAWLSTARPETNEDRVMKVLGLVWSKADRKAIDESVAELLAAQRPDGGWAQLATLETDAYATGQALVALHEAGKPSTDRAYQLGVTYLLRTQMADGSWVVRSRSSPFQPLKDSGFPHGRDQWISASGTAWASMALAYSQPASAPSPSLLSKR
jgi:hypothetical protein